MKTFDDSDEIEIRPDCYETVLTYWNIPGGFLARIFNSWTLRRDVESSVYITDMNAMS